MNYRVLDLFSGIGGFSLGLEAAGMTTAAFCEVSPKCRHLLQHHWPEAPIYDDVCTLTADRLAADGIAVDVICGGFPCQDLSFAGKGAGLSGKRSGLWSEFARLIRELRPRVVIVENVSALLSRGLGVVLGDLAACGYDAEWDCIPASAVGAPHRRDRLWIVAYARGEQHEGFGDAFRRALAAELSQTSLADAGDGGYGPDNGPGQDSGETSEGQGDKPEHGQRLRIVTGGGGQNVADAPRERQSETRGLRRGAGSERYGLGAPHRSCWTDRGDYDWSFEPAVGRVANGVPARVDRLHGLGNAVVPEIPKRLGRAILQAEAA